MSKFICNYILVIMLINTNMIHLGYYITSTIFALPVHLKESELKPKI